MIWAQRSTEAPRRASKNVLSSCWQESFSIWALINGFHSMYISRYCTTAKSIYPWLVNCCSICRDHSASSCVKLLAPDAVWETKWFGKENCCYATPSFCVKSNMTCGSCSEYMLCRKSSQVSKTFTSFIEVWCSCNLILVNRAVQLAFRRSSGS